MDEFQNNNKDYFKKNSKKLHQSSSQIDMKSNSLRKKPQTNFVSLNHLYVLFLPVATDSNTNSASSL